MLPRTNMLNFSVQRIFDARGIEYCPQLEIYNVTNTDVWYAEASASGSASRVSSASSTPIKHAVRLSNKPKPPQSSYPKTHSRSGPLYGEKVKDQPAYLVITKQDTEVFLDRFRSVRCELALGLSHGRSRYPCHGIAGGGPRTRCAAVAEVKVPALPAPRQSVRRATRSGPEGSPPR